MKNTPKITLLLAALLCLAGCSKCPPESNDHIVAYRLNQGAEQRAVLTSDDEFRELLGRFCDYAVGGAKVTFYNASRPQQSTALSPKEAVEYSTASREEMTRWMAEMEDAGMTVTVVYDSATGTWHGTAYALPPQPPAPSGGLATYECNDMNDFGYIWSFDTVNRRVYITLHDTRRYFTAPDYPVGAYEYRGAIEVNTPSAYWLIDTWGDTAGLYVLEFSGSRTPCGGDTLHFNATRLSNPVTLVRTDHWHTYLCSNQGPDIAMHTTGSVIEIWPEQYIGQLGVGSSLGRFDLVWRFELGRFVMNRKMAGHSDTFALTLDYRPFGGSNVGIDTIGGFTIQGEPCADSQFTITGGGPFRFQRL